MPIKITKAFQWSPNGYDVTTVEIGEHESLPDRAAEIALQLGVVGEQEQTPATPPVAVVATAAPESAQNGAGSEPSQVPSAASEGAATDQTEGKSGRRRNRAAGA
ncbi:hypothetical protein LMG26696_02623 [Achromobacter pulmonis]|uniref:hypothetical protein n=1 Tax=Achromobacter pulmonis TaxID=1389932 RepID=UPI001465DB88|nr:hypothetical protein [Achromobacter pulmonis]CAB3647649.1 hypothetical protein LMG26696_02623 [Achromobacter pulmonis]